MITFESGTDLVGDAFDQSDVMVLERALLAPNKTEQTKCFSGDMNRGNQSRFAAKLSIKEQTDRKWQLRIGELQCFTFP